MDSAAPAIEPWQRHLERTKKSKGRWLMSVEKEAKDFGSEHLMRALALPLVTGKSQQRKALQSSRPFHP